jgi:hypothetical protein
MAPAKESRWQSDQSANAQGQKAHRQRVAPGHLRQIEKVSHETVPGPQDSKGAQQDGEKAKADYSAMLSGSKCHVSLLQ